jgi:hypothetical protein
MACARSSSWNTEPQAAPGFERFVGDEDHRATAAMALVVDVKQRVGRVGPYVRYPPKKG